MITKAPVASPARPTATSGRLIYAVGDIHGNLELFEALIEAITADAITSEPGERPMLILLGDYVDRGDDSAGVIELVLALESAGAFEVRPLKGNHDAAVLSFLDDKAFGPTWAAHGGAATLLSYGVAAPSGEDPDRWAVAQAAFAEALPLAHRDLFSRLELMVTVGDYVFVHAGLRPGAPLDQQSEHDLMWIRRDFLAYTEAHEKIVVHGHTPTEAPELKAYRLGIDTGAYATGVLTALRLEGADRHVIQARYSRLSARE